MRLVRVALAKLHALVHRDVVAREIRDEMRFHVEMRAKEYERDGLTERAAHRRARSRFGNFALMLDHGYDVRGGGVMETIWQDVRYGVRLLVKDRGFSLVAILTLALGIGVSTALFSVVDAAYLRPLPYPNPEQLVDVTMRTRNKQGQMVGAMAPSFNDLEDWRRSSRVFSHLSQARENNGRVLVDAGQPERLTVGSLSRGYLETFGIAPFLGRSVLEEDTRPGAPAVVLLGHAYWQSRFGGDRGVLGRLIRVSGEPATVVGVLPAGFYRATSVWQPMADVDSSLARMRGSGTPTYGRLAPGISLARASQELTNLSLQIAASERRPRNFDVQLRSLYGETTEEYGPTIKTLVGAVVGVLLIACINVAGLLLARGAVRQPELAIRASIGAGRARLVRQLLTESLILALASGLGGVLLAWLLLDALVALLPLSLPPNSPPAINLQVLAFGAGLSVAASLVFGLVPALRLSRVQIGAHLARAGRRHGSALSRRGGQLLIGAEVALALVLLAGAGLMMRSFVRALSIDVGFDPRTFVTMEIFPVDQTPEVQHQYFLSLLETIRAMPGVVAAGAINYAPLSRSSMYTDAKGQGDDVFAAIKEILPGYFEAIGVVPLEGRLPTEADAWSGGVAISRTAARQLFPDGSPIGRQFTTQMTKGTAWTVIGVVADIRSRDAFKPYEADVYLPASTGGPENPFGHDLTVVVRPKGDSTGLSDRLRRAAEGAGPRVIVERVRAGSDWFGDNVEKSRHQTLLIGLLGGFGLTLTLVGVFGMTAYAVARRTQEIGVRLAFGARPIDVVARMVRDALWPVLYGLLVGLGGAYYATRVIESFLFQTPPHDPVTFAVVASVMGATAMLAAWIPARRAARVDPVVALRAE